MEEKKTSKKTYVTIGIVVIVLIVATLITLYFTLWNTSSNYMKYITDKQYAQANDYYNKRVRGKTEKETSIEDKTNNYLKQLLSDYANGTKTYDDVKTELQSISALTPAPSRT